MRKSGRVTGRGTEMKLKNNRGPYLIGGGFVDNWYTYKLANVFSSFHSFHHFGFLLLTCPWVSTNNNWPEYTESINYIIQLLSTHISPSECGTVSLKTKLTWKSSKNQGTPAVLWERIPYEMARSSWLSLHSVPLWKRKMGRRDYKKYRMVGFLVNKYRRKKKQIFNLIFDLQEL